MVQLYIVNKHNVVVLVWYFPIVIPLEVRQLYFALPWIVAILRVGIKIRVIQKSELKGLHNAATVVAKVLWGTLQDLLAEAFLLTVGVLLFRLWLF